MKRLGTIGIVGMVLVAMGGASALAAEAFKVAIMDQQAVMEQSKAGKRALEDMKSYSVTRQKIINADDQELKEMETSLQDPNSKLSEQARQEKQEQFRARLEAYQRRLGDFNREIQEKQREMVSDYVKKIEAAAQAVAQREGYLAVLDKGGDSRVVLYYQPALDITAKVVKEFDAQNK